MYCISDGAKTAWSLFSDGVCFELKGQEKGLLESDLGGGGEVAL